jgi:hypothetical protein
MKSSKPTMPFDPHQGHFPFGAPSSYNSKDRDFRKSARDLRLTYDGRHLTYQHKD